jgi:dTDP-4-dehydrorhamnose reductase
LERAQSNLPVEAVADQVSCLTWTSHLAQRISELVEIAPTGILHLTGSGPCTRFEIAQRIVEALPNPVVVSPIDWGKLNLPAKRPEYSAMESQRLAELGIQPLPHWKLALDEYLQLRKVVPVTAKGIKLGVEP